VWPVVRDVVGVVCDGRPLDTASHEMIVGG
jgi:hypothetical protein